MKRIDIYDYDQERIDRICEKYDLTTYALVELLLDNVSEEDEDNVFG